MTGPDTSGPSSTSQDDAETMCPLCLTVLDEPDVVSASRRISSSSPRLFVCPQCGLEAWLTVGASSEVWYASNAVYVGRDIEHPDYLSSAQRMYLTRHKAGGTSVLDLDCGTGAFLAAVRTTPDLKYGVDFSSRAVAIARDRYGLRHVVRADLEQLTLVEDIPASSDVVRLFDVLEHVRSVGSVLDAACKRVRLGGLHVLSVPCRDRLLPDLSPWDWPPHHLTRWNIKAVEHAAAQHGFTVSYSTTLERFKDLFACARSSLGHRLRMGAVKRFSGYATPTQSASAHAPWRVQWHVRTLWIVARAKDLLVVDLPSGLFASFMGVVSLCSRHTGAELYVELRRGTGTVD